MDHHKFILDHSSTSWKWNNLLLFNDTWLSTLDLWVTEVLPTIVFCMITGIWEIAVFYYLWASLIQEIIEHNPKFNIFPLLTSGRWHLLHHTDDRVNFGLFIPVSCLIHIGDYHENTRIISHCSMFLGLSKTR